MQVSSYLFKNGAFEKSRNPNFDTDGKQQLVMGFGNKALITNEAIYKTIREKFGNAQLALCSTAGEIYDSATYEDSIALTAIAFDNTKIQTTSVNIAAFASSFDAGAKLVNQLDKEELKNIFILSDGSLVNGSELVRGIKSAVGDNIPVTGGMAGDGTRFQSTAVGLNQLPEAGTIIAIGFYGEHIKIANGTMGGWEVFGLERTVTRSSSNILEEIDNKNALELYKQYLGKYADELPGSALLFPLHVQLPDSNECVVRTILGINAQNNMVFAGDVPLGSKVRFMRANFDNLIDAASIAAQNSLQTFSGSVPKLAILISCVGRKIILDKRAEEEVEAVIEVMDKDIISTGFYSYGEISPLSPTGSCQLHNQTMTITTFSEL